MTKQIDFRFFVCRERQLRRFAVKTEGSKPVLPRKAYTGKTDAPKPLNRHAEA